MRNLRNALFGRSILLGLALAMIAITTIGVGGIATSVIVAERVQGSGSAINVAGSLRKQSHRMGSQVLADRINHATSHGALLVAMAQFEASLADPALQNALIRAPDSDFATTYRSVQHTWKNRLKPLLAEEAMSGPNLLPASHHNELLGVIDAFVDEINTMVAQLEVETEARIGQLRTILAVALVLIVAVLLVAMAWVHKRLLSPLEELLASATNITRGDFTTRNGLTGQDELGRLGQAFNTMTEELSKLYRGLEQRVAEKTAALSRSNQSLELLYHSISRLHNAPVAPETYRAMLKDIEQVLGLTGSMACLLPKHGGSATLLASSLADCPDQESGGCARCTRSLAEDATWHYRREGNAEWLIVPLRDNEGLYGVMRLALPPGRRLEPWQEQLLEALSRHIGIALGISRKTEQERLLALQEERSVIARELHDSIAQSLSYMKIQASLLQPVLADPEHRRQAEATLRDLREGITSAYRQLRELLVTFRLKMQGDFLELLQRTVNEMAGRSGTPIELETRLEGCHLTPNQEIHSLQIIREALYNVVRHAQASWVRVEVGHAAGEVRISVEDDGVGLPPAGGAPPAPPRPPLPPLRPQHHARAGRQPARDDRDRQPTAGRNPGAAALRCRAGHAPDVVAAGRDCRAGSLPPHRRGRGGTMIPAEITVAIVDDHPLFRRGLIQLLNTVPGMRLVGEASCGRDGIALAKQTQPALLLLDLNMKDMSGLEVLKAVKAGDSETRVVMITVSDQAEDLVAALRIGADGYLLKDMEPEQMVESLQAAAAGRVIISEVLTHVLAAALRDQHRPESPQDADLTEQEVRILERLATGMSNKVIGRELDIAEGTVKVHVKHILRKLGLKSRVEAAVWAVEHLPKGKAAG